MAELKIEIYHKYWENNVKAKIQEAVSSLIGKDVADINLVGFTENSFPTRMTVTIPNPSKAILINHYTVKAKIVDLLGAVKSK